MAKKYCKPWNQIRLQYNGPNWHDRYYTRHQLRDLFTDTLLAEYYIPSPNWIEENPKNQYYWELSDNVIKALRTKSCYPDVLDRLGNGNFCLDELAAKTTIENYLIIAGYEVLPSKLAVMI